MKIKDIKAIKAAETQQYCGDVLCTDCIFYFRNDCIVSDTRSCRRDEYTPADWLIDLIKGEQFHEFKGVK